MEVNKMKKNKKNKKNILRTLWKAYWVIGTVSTTITFVRARGLKKEDDRHLLGKAIDRIAGRDIEPDRIVTIDGIDLKVSYNPYVQLFTGTIGGVACVLNCVNEVYVDDQFRKMSKETQYAILCHELGHRKLAHTAYSTYMFDRMVCILNNKVLPMELEADEYACKIASPVIVMNALEEMKNIKGISKKELSLRVKHIYDNYERLKDEYMNS